MVALEPMLDRRALYNFPVPNITRLDRMSHNYTVWYLIRDTKVPDKDAVIQRLGLYFAL